MTNSPSRFTPWLCGLLLVCLAPAVSAQDTARYTFENESMASTDGDSQSVATDLVAFNSTMFWHGNGHWNLCLTSDWNETTEQSPANGSQNYLEFTVTPNAGRALLSGSITINIGYSGDRPVDAVAAYADEDPGPGGDNFQTKLGEVLDLYQHNSGYDYYVIDLSGATWLQEAEGPVTFRLYFWNEDSSGDGSMEIAQICLEGSTLAGLAKLGDYVWLDTDEDGLQDSGEPGVEGVVTHLVDAASGTILDTTTTDADGLYLFCTDAGSYRICWELPAGYTFTQVDAGTNGNIDSDADPATGCTTHIVNIQRGQQRMYNDAGLLPCTGTEALSLDLGGSCNLALDPVMNIGLPILGTVTMLDVDSQFPNAFGFLFASFGPVQPYTVPGIGCTIYVDILNPSNFYLVTMFMADGDGNWQLPIPIPDVPAMMGLELVLQARLCAPNAPVGPLDPDWLSNGVLIRAGCPPLAP